MSEPMTPDLRAAAERIRLAMHHGCYVGEPGAIERDERLLAQMYVLEHPADDGEDADIAWLESLSREGGDMSWLAVRLCEDRKFHLMAPSKKPTEGIEGLNDWVSPNPATRGDVRRLAAALGITLTEKAE